MYGEFNIFSNHETLLQDLLENEPKFVLNFAASYLNNSRKEYLVMALLEVLKVPYTGVDGRHLLYATHKRMAKQLLDQFPKEIKTPQEQLYYKGMDLASLDYPVFVKLALGDGSIGIYEGSLAKTPSDLQKALDVLKEKHFELFEKGVLLQEFLGGPEYTVALIGNPGKGFRRIGIGKVIYNNSTGNSPKFKSFETKNATVLKSKATGSTTDYGKCDLNSQQQDQIFSMCEKAFEVLSIRDYGRFDVRFSESSNLPKLIDANPNPSWDRTASFSLVAALNSISYFEVVSGWIDAMLDRLNMK